MKNFFLPPSAHALRAYFFLPNKEKQSMEENKLKKILNEIYTEEIIKILFFPKNLNRALGNFSSLQRTFE